MSLKVKKYKLFLNKLWFWGGWWILELQKLTGQWAIVLKLVVHTKVDIYVSIFIYFKTQNVGKPHVQGKYAIFKPIQNA